MRRTFLAIAIACAVGCPVQAPTDRAADPVPTPARPPAEGRNRMPAPVAEEASVEPAPARPIVGEFRRALVALHAGDEAPFQAILAPAAQWRRPVADPEARDRDALVAAFADGIAEPTRILDLGAGGFAIQLSTKDGRGTLALVDVAEGRIADVRTYGADPRTPLPRARATRPAGVSRAAVASGRPNLKHVALTKRLYDAATARAWSKIEATIAPDAPHETHGDIDSAGSAETTLAGSFAALLADPGARLTIRKQHAVADWVLVEAVVAEGDGPTLTPRVGLVDVLRLHDGHVVASFRYVNLRG